MSKSYWSCAELAALALPGYPATDRNWRDLVTRESWESRPREGRGGGLEYRPPAAIAAMILATQVSAPTVSSLPATAPALPTGMATPSVPAAFYSPHELTDKQRLERDARQGVLGAIRHLQDQAGCSREAAMHTLLVSARAGKLEAHLDKMLRLARDRRGRAGDGYPSTRTLKRWLGAQDLTPRIAVQDMAIPAWAAAFLRYYQQPQKPSIAQAYRQFCNANPGERPSIHQVRRFLDKMGAVSLETGRRLPRELKHIKPFVRRTTDHMWPDDCYTADGHTFDAEVAHPRHGKAFRPEITTVLSVSSRKCVGWSIGLAESTWGVLDAQRHAIETHGIPALWYFDRGPGFDNLMQSDELIGFIARWGGEITHSIPYNSESRGLEERSHRTFLIPAAKKLPTYMGAAMDREARQKIHKITRADIRLTGTSRHLMAFDDFKAFLRTEIDAYNARPHSALPKIIDPATGKKRHMSPDEAWAAALAEGWNPTLVTPAERDDLFRPYTTAKVLRGEIRLFNNLYFSHDLTEFHGETVRVGYDIHDASRVWVRSHQDGSLICVAEFEANHRAYFPQAVIDQAAQKRAQAREKRLQGHLDEVREELEGRLPAIEHQVAESLTAQAFRSVCDLEQVGLRAPEDIPANVAVLPHVEARPLFGNDPDMYRWLMRHPAQWTEGDADWLLDYAESDDYADLAERYTFQGVAWSAEDRLRAENLINKELAAR